MTLFALQPKMPVPMDTDSRAEARPSHDRAFGGEVARPAVYYGAIDEEVRILETCVRGGTCVVPACCAACARICEGGVRACVHPYMRVRPH